MKILVTGAAGFIGSYLIPDLVQKGHRVSATDVAPLPGSLKGVSGDVEYIRADMSREADIYRLMVKSRPEAVIHLVSLLAGPCEENPMLGFQINFRSTLTLLDAGINLGLEKFIMTSSISVFGRGLPEPVKDDAEKNPALIYGQTKLACEHLLDWYKRKHGLKTGAVRFPWVFGPGRETGITALYSSKLLDAIAKGLPLTIDNPDETGDWLYVKDAVKSLNLLLEADEPSQTAYNIMGGLHSIRSVMDIARKIRPAARIEFIEGRQAQSPYPSAYDDSNARKDLGWKPDYSIEQAVKEHIEIVEAQA
jgi:nucleoside-diphosphate-sugar epimerase